jgi:hypothetical protein
MSRESIHLGQEQWRKIHELAERSGTSADEVANRAVDALYASQAAGAEAGQPAQSLYDALISSGSMGSLHGAPRDLSTNRDHMRGFGESARA